MSVNSCGNFEKILDYVQQLLPPEERQEMQLHIDECQRCQKLVEEAQELVTCLREDSQLAVSSKVHQQVVNFYSGWYATRPKPVKSVAGLRKWLAQLVVDTRLNPGQSLAVGLRTGATTEQSGMRQLLYTVDDGHIEVDLQLSPSASRLYYNLIGQVIGLEPVEARVELAPNSGGATLETEVDPNFTFRFQKLEPGDYNMSIYFKEDWIEIPLIQI